MRRGGGEILQRQRRWSSLGLRRLTGTLSSTPVALGLLGLSGNRFVVPYGWREKERRGPLKVRSPRSSPGTSGQGPEERFPGAGAGQVNSPANPDSKALFPFEVKGQR